MRQTGPLMRRRRSVRPPRDEPPLGAQPVLHVLAVRATLHLPDRVGLMLGLLQRIDGIAAGLGPRLRRPERQIHGNLGIALYDLRTGGSAALIHVHGQSPLFSPVFGRIRPRYIGWPTSSQSMNSDTLPHTCAWSPDDGSLGFYPQPTRLS